MENTKVSAPKTTNINHKEIALRSQRIRDLQKLKAESKTTEKDEKPWKCLSCIWLHDCNSQCVGGCEEYERDLIS